LVQNKIAEMGFSQRELTEGVWTDTKAQIADRKRQLDYLKPIITKGNLILDVGSGPGTYGTLLACQGHEVVGIDISVGNAQFSKRRAKENKCNFSPIVGDLEKQPFKDNSFDICFCAFTLHHFPEIASPLNSLFRISKRKGRIILIEPNGSNP